MAIRKLYYCDKCNTQIRGEGYYAKKFAADGSLPEKNDYKHICLRCMNSFIEPKEDKSTYRKDR